MQKKPAYTHIVVVLAWKRSSFQQLPREKPGIWLKLQRTHPKMRSTPQAIPSLPSAAPTLREHLPTKAHPAPSPTCSCSSAPEALPSQPLPSTSLGCSQMKTNQEGQRQPPLTGRGQMRSEAARWWVESARCFLTSSVQQIPPSCEKGFKVLRCSWCLSLTQGLMEKEKQLGTPGAAKDGGAAQLCGTRIPAGYGKGLKFDFSLKPSFQLS